MRGFPKLPLPTSAARSPAQPTAWGAALALALIAALAACGESVRDPATPAVPPVSIPPTTPPPERAEADSETWVEAWLAAGAPDRDTAAPDDAGRAARAEARELVVEGDRLRAAGQDQEALARYRAAVARAPDEPGPRYALAATLSEAGDPRGALAQLRSLRELGAPPQLRTARVDARFEALRRGAKTRGAFRALTGFYPVAVAGTRGLARRVGDLLPDPAGAMAERLRARGIPAQVRATPWRSGARVATVVYARDIPAAKAMAQEVARAMVFPPRMIASKRFDASDPVVVVVPPSAARALAAARGASVRDLMDQPLAARGPDGATHRLRFEETGSFHWETEGGAALPPGWRRDRRGRYLFTGARLHLTYREELSAAPGAGAANPTATPDPEAPPLRPGVQQGRRSSFDVTLTPEGLQVGELVFRPEARGAPPDPPPALRTEAQEAAFGQGGKRLGAEAWPRHVERPAACGAAQLDAAHTRDSKPNPRVGGGSGATLTP